MSRIPLALSVRFDSARLPGKCMLPFGKYNSVIEYIVERARLHDLRPIVFTSKEYSDDVIEIESKRIDVEYFRGSLDNKISRWRDGLEQFGLLWAHFADMDDPFLDPNQIRKSIEIFNANHFDMLSTSKLSDQGFASVGTSIRKPFLDLLAKRVLAFHNQDFDVIPWNLLINESDAVDIFSDVKYIKREDIRLTLDYKEDYLLLNSLAYLFGPDARREDIEVHLDENPALLDINRNCTKDFQQNKLVKLKKFKENRESEVY